MTHFTDVTGLLGSAIAIVAVSAQMPGVSRLANARRNWLLAAVFVAVLIPTGGLPMAAYLRGAIGDLSTTAVLLLCSGLLHGMRNRTNPPGKDGLLPLAAITAVIFYPLALGWGSFDPYRLGYGDYWFLAGLLGVALYAVWRGLATMAVAIALGVLAWSTGWYESTNLWDYLLDPLVSVYAVFALSMRGIRKLRTP